MDWFRHYHGLCTDPKLHRASRMAKVHRSVAIAAWCAVLETASQSDPRGSAADIDHESLAFMIDESTVVASRMLSAFRSLGMLGEANKVAAWDKRQRISDDVNGRVRKHREKVSNTKPLNGHDPEPGSNVTETPRNVENRTEQIREDKTPAAAAESPPPHAPAREEAAAAAVDPVDMLTNELMTRAGPAGAMREQVRRSVNAWVDCLGQRRVAAVVADALRQARSNPVAVAGIKAAEAIERLEHAKAVATMPLPEQPDPWMETNRRNRQRDEEQGYADFTAAPRSLLN